MQRKNKAELEYLTQKNELLILEANKSSEIEIAKFKQMVSAIGSETYVYFLFLFFSFLFLSLYGKLTLTISPKKNKQKKN